jgi:hypothetical protein
MKISEYSGFIFFGILTIVSVIVGIVNSDKNVLMTSNNFIVMTLVAYVIVYVKAIRKELTDLKKSLDHK